MTAFSAGVLTGVSIAVVVFLVLCAAGVLIMIGSASRDYDEPAEWPSERGEK